IRDIAQLSRNSGNSLPEFERKVMDPNLETHLQDAERRLFDSYRRFCHHMPAAARLDANASTAVRAELTAAKNTGVSFPRGDTPGRDLSGLDLPGMDFTEGLLESVTLAGANLSDAIFQGATLARADLRGADLSNATLVDTNFGYARLESAKLADA